MEIKRLVVGQLATNCYLVWEEKTRKVVIIDPGDDGEYLIQQIQSLELSPQAILATHGHFDHLLAATELKLAFSIPFLINQEVNQEDIFLLDRLQKSAKHFLGISVDPPPAPDRFLKENDIIPFGGEKLTVIETPGHTPGSVCFYGETILFSGDTLFSGGAGRTDFSYSSREELDKSLKKLFKLPPDTLVYPGHGAETTIGQLKQVSPVNRIT